MSTLAFQRYQIILLKIIFFLRFLADCLFAGFTALYLNSLGFGEDLIGTINSLQSITVLIINPFWAIVAKDSRLRRILLIVLSAINGTLCIIYGNLSTYEAILVLTAFIAVATAPYVQLLDSYSITACSAYSYEYSKIRIMGSIAALIGFLIGGFLIDRIGYRKTFLIAGAILIFMSFIVMLTKNVEQECNQANEKRNIRALLKNIPFMSYTIASLICFVPSSVGISFFPIYLQNVHGFSASEYSYISIATVLIEIIVVAIAPYVLKGAKPRALLMIVFIIDFIKALAIGIPNLPLAVVLILNSLKGVAVGITCYFNLKYIFKLVGNQNVTSAIMFNQILSSILLIILNIVFGKILVRFGYNVAYSLSAGMMLISIIGYPILCHILKKRNLIED